MLTQSQPCVLVYNNKSDSDVLLYFFFQNCTCPVTKQLVITRVDGPLGIFIIADFEKSCIRFPVKRGTDIRYKIHFK